MCSTVAAVGGWVMFVAGAIIATVLIFVIAIMVGSGREAELERRERGEP